MYISLPSDSCSDIFTDNVISNYKIKLAHEIKLPNDQYSLALLSVSWPHSFNNISSGNVLIGCYGGQTGVLSIASVDYEANHYESVESLLDHLNRAINAGYANYENLDYDGDDFVVLKLNSSNKVVFRAKARAGDSMFYLNLTDELYIKLGFGLKPDKSNIVETGTTAKHIPDLNAGLGNIFVYCSLMRPSRIIGEKHTNVLRVLPTIGQHGKMVHYQPKKLEYFPLNLNQFSEVGIEIRDELGRLYDFQSGKVNIDVHIKKTAMTD